ncbi:ABC transporter permease [Aquimarina spongiae]|uniref:Putative ABC transport system permease protein n=1 Tax=Aquimarina spongiae TaxID=570521 RepID=A0A1M6EZG1_9FLAO|nr:ABC transporter permease [Aquimarina spongiae]SHI90776.1 putative ABC transport system permease protein [Aquimarina spongiae]
MYTLYFKIALRYLLKNKLYSFINIAGLAIGVASFILLMVYIRYEHSYDRFDGSENVYRAYMDYLEGDTYVAGDAQTYNQVGPTLKKEFQEVEDYVRFYRLGKTTLKNQHHILEISDGCVADPTYFDIFSQNLTYGDTRTALTEPNTIVLTASLAQTLFGDQNPIGKTLQFFQGSSTLVKVTGVLPDLDQNSHFKIGYLISYSTLPNLEAVGDNIKRPNWNNNTFFTYLKIDEKADATLLQKKIVDRGMTEVQDERMNIEPIEDIHLYSNKPYEAEANGSITRIKFLTAIAFIILILSWLNYINLSTTKSLERAKEIGIRKVAGAQKQQLIVQSLLESFMLNIAAIIIAIIIATLILPIYNEFTGKTLRFEIDIIQKLLPILGIILLGMMLAGLYPAIVLSRYTPSKALKGKVRTSAQGLHIRKALIITQFLATIILLIGTIVVTKQINFINDQPIGSDLNNVLAIQGEILTNKSDSLLRADFSVLSQELKQNSIVLSTGLSNTYPGDGYDNLSSFMGMTYPDGTINEQKVWYTYEANTDYFEVMGIEFLAGKTFKETPKGYSKDIIVNAEFVKEVGITNVEEALHKKVKFWGRDWNIVGIIKDYHHFGVKNPVEPMVLRYTPTRDVLLVKLNPSVTSVSGYNTALNELQKTWSSVFPSSTFNYTFLDKKFQKQYEEDNKFRDAFKIFTALAIFIAALGLFGLTSYTCIQRKKEIGIRKVNGATIFKILKLLNIDFIKWVGVAFFIAVPISWYAMNAWLQNFAIKTSLNWWIFGLAGIIALGITLLTVSWQSFAAASANPVDALRDE